MVPNPGSLLLINDEARAVPPSTENSSGLELFGLDIMITNKRMSPITIKTGKTEPFLDEPESPPS